MSDDKAPDFKPSPAPRSTVRRPPVGAMALPGMTAPPAPAEAAPAEAALPPGSQHKDVVANAATVAVTEQLATAPTQEEVREIAGLAAATENVAEPEYTRQSKEGVAAAEVAAATAAVAVAAAVDETQQQQELLQGPAAAPPPSYSESQAAHVGYPQLPPEQAAPAGGYTNPYPAGYNTPHPGVVPPGPIPPAGHVVAAGGYQVVPQHLSPEAPAGSYKGEVAYGAIVSTQPAAGHQQHAGHQLSAQREWDKGLCDCLSSCGICLLSCFCPCIVVGRNAEAMGHSCCMYGVGSIIPLIRCVAQIVLRQELRKRRGIVGSDFGDFCTVWCCGLCALTQEANEVKKMMESGQSMARE